MFSNVSGKLTIPANGTLQLDVTFIGESSIGFISVNFGIDWPSNKVPISLNGEVDFSMKLSTG